MAYPNARSLSRAVASRLQSERISSDRQVQSRSQSKACSQVQKADVKRSNLGICSTSRQSFYHHLGALCKQLVQFSSAAEMVGPLNCLDRKVGVTPIKFPVAVEPSIWLHCPSSRARVVRDEVGLFPEDLRDAHPARRPFGRATCVISSQTGMMHLGHSSAYGRTAFRQAVSVVPAPEDCTLG